MGPKSDSRRLGIRQIIGSRADEAIAGAGGHAPRDERALMRFASAMENSPDSGRVGRGNGWSASAMAAQPMVHFVAIGLLLFVGYRPSTGRERATRPHRADRGRSAPDLRGVARAGAPSTDARADEEPDREQGPRGDPLSEAGPRPGEGRHHRHAGWRRRWSSWPTTWRRCASPRAPSCGLVRKNSARRRLHARRSDTCTLARPRR
jgi:hypothetical protein